jgi:hypothetical protein
MADQTSFTKEPNIKVESDISVRWNSTHDMLQSALRVSRAFTALSIHLVKDFTRDPNETSLDEIDWDTARSTLTL